MSEACGRMPHEVRDCLYFGEAGQSRWCRSLYTSVTG